MTPAQAQAQAGTSAAGERRVFGPEFFDLASPASAPASVGGTRLSMEEDLAALDAQRWPGGNLAGT